MLKKEGINFIAYKKWGDIIIGKNKEPLEKEIDYKIYLFYKVSKPKRDTIIYRVNKPLTNYSCDISMNGEEYYFISDRDLYKLELQVATKTEPSTGKPKPRRHTPTTDADKPLLLTI